MTTDKYQDLWRRVQDILPSKAAFVQRLGGGPLRVYQGFDPTGSKLHLGHTIGMRNLQTFVEMGHHVIALFGTGTVMVGDPSERNTGRKLITEAEIEDNLESWKAQVGKVLDLSKVEIRYNGDWLIPMTLKDIIGVASHISAIQLFKRESFTRRIDKGDTVWYHETLYPLLQGYDSVKLDIDVEIGGTDQTFNMLIGRELQKKINNREKFVLTNPMILGTDGKPMSKTSGNCIFIEDSAEVMYRKIMSLPDDVMPSYFQLVSTLSSKDLQELPQDPMNRKKVLAHNITQSFHGLSGANQAETYFKQTVQEKQLPEDISLITSKPTTNPLEISLLIDPMLSRSKAKRLIEAGGFKLDSKARTNPLEPLDLKGGEVVKLGKRQFARIKL